MPRMHEMSEKKINWRKRCSELEALLQKERVKVEYYQSLARSSGKKSLREISKLSRIIAERKGAEKALRESEKRFSLFMDHLPAIVFIKDEKNRGVYVNKHMNDVLGAKKWIGTTPFDVFPKEIAERMITDDKKAFSEGYRVITEKVPDKNGTEHTYQTYKFRIDHHGAPPLLGGIALDITEQKQKEQAIREKDRELQIKATSLEEVNTALRAVVSQC